ncbi:NAD(P)H-dependent oxidoreductase subunit E [Parabacteroides distasonis]|nr:NAD(P)H-dependent oxidoreductase subunit E [Parabacteroides distasonis]
MCNGHLSKEQVGKLHAICAERNNDPGELINILHAAQELLGYLPQVVQQVIAADLHIPVSRVYGVVTFYSFFTMEPKGKHPISVCLGTACYVRGAEKVLEEIQKELEIKVGETTSDGLFSLDTLRCVGACGLAPVVTIGGKVYGRVTPEKVRDILQEYFMQAE